MFGLFRSSKLRHPHAAHSGYTVHSVGTPGVGNLTLDREFTDPLFLLQGAGKFVVNSLGCVSRPLDANQPSAPVAIIAGINQQTGQFVTTGLVNSDLSPAD